MIQSSGCLSQVWLFAPLSPFFLCVYMHSLLNLMGEEQWSLQHSHSPAESTRLSPAFLFPFISFSLFPPGKKTPATFFFFFIQGGGSWACVSKIWVKSVPFDTASPLLFPLCFTWLVKQQSFKKGRRKRRCILSLPLAVSQYAPAVSCGLFLMTGKKKRKKKEGWVSSPPAACTQAQLLRHTHTRTHYCSWVWDFHREVFNLHWGLASHTAQPKPPTYSHALFLWLTPTYSRPSPEQWKQQELSTT